MRVEKLQGRKLEKLAGGKIMKHRVLFSEKTSKDLTLRITRKSHSFKLESDQMRLPFRKMTLAKKNKMWKLVWRGLLFSVKGEQSGGYCSGHTR